MTSQHLQLRYMKLLRYMTLATSLIILSILNFIAMYLLFPEQWVKGLSISTLLALLGIGIYCIIENETKKLLREHADH